MDISVRIDRLAQNISSLLLDFTAETGLVVNAIHANPVEVTGFGEQPQFVYGEIGVDIVYKATTDDD